MSEEETGGWPKEGMRYLKSLGFSIASMALHDESVDIDDSRLRTEEKLAVILGTEVDGLWMRRSSFRLHDQDSHGSWRGFTECGGSQCSCILAAGKTLNI